MKKHTHFIGIDVSKSTLDVIILNSENPDDSKYYKIDNQRKAIRALLKKLPSSILVCFEHTGNYGLNLKYELLDKQLDFWIENPLLIKRFKGFKRGKNDKADARDIAEYARANQHKANLYTLEEDSILKIRLLLNQREKVMKCIVMFKQSKESNLFYPKKIKKSIDQSDNRQLKHLEKELKWLEGQINKVLSENQELKDKLKLAKSVKGIGDQTALYMLVRTKGFTCFQNWRKFACYIGTAPFEYSSGTSIKGKTKVSHYADKKLKSLFNLAALTARQYDPEIKAYYERKLLEGKNKMLILNNVRNKLIARVFAVIKRGTPYVNTQKFAT